MKIKKFFTSKTLYYVLIGIVFLEIIGASLSVAFANDSIQRDLGLSNLFLGVLAFILLSMPFFIESRLKIRIPNYLKVIVLLFIFAAIVLGNIHNFLVHYQGIYDKLLHIVSGITIAIIGFEIVRYINHSKGEKLSFSPGLIAIFAFTFSVTLLVIWEFYEFFVDTLAYQFNSDTERNMQRFRTLYEGNFYPHQGVHGYGLIDTMLDLLVGFIGAALVSVVGWRILIHEKIQEENKEMLE
jgi:hypothetical protein